ncbi:hypothetical protein G3A39_38795 [Paraburkholderia aspalathi]|nr:hypothetical protein [Paraburkholderia aspalathi]
MFEQAYVPLGHAYPQTFMMGGAFPDGKVAKKFGGHVMIRNHSKGRHCAFARSGVIIPNEITTGATRSAFDRIARPLLQQRVNAAITKLLR